jgi:hypothetical protein
LPRWPAALLAVPTYRTTATNGSAAAVTDHVGGEVPGKADAGNGSTTLAALTTSTNAPQSITSVVLGTNSVTGLDFGFNFNTVVNVNDSGQGSLRQFLLVHRHLRIRRQRAGPHGLGHFRLRLCGHQPQLPQGR